MMSIYRPLSVETAVQELALYRRGALRLTEQQIKNKRGLVKALKTPNVNKLQTHLREWSNEHFVRKRHGSLDLSFFVKLPWVMCKSEKKYSRTEFCVIKYNKITKTLIEKRCIDVSTVQLHTRFSYIGSKKYYDLFKKVNSEYTEYIAVLKESDVFCAARSVKDAIKGLKYIILNHSTPIDWLKIKSNFRWRLP